MKLQPLTNGSVTGTGTFELPNRILGGILITADGTADATVLVKKDDTNGFEVFQLVTKSPTFIVAPIAVEGTATVFYSVSGTGAAAQFYEWVE